MITIGGYPRACERSWGLSFSWVCTLNLAALLPLSNGSTRLIELRGNLPDLSGNFRDQVKSMYLDKGTGFMGEALILELFRSSGFRIHDEIECMSHHVNYLTSPKKTAGYRMPDLHWHSLTGDNIYLEVKTTTCGRWRMEVDDLAGLRQWVGMHEGAALYTLGIELIRLSDRDPYDRVYLVSGIYVLPGIPATARKRWDPHVSLIVKNGGRRFTVRGLGVTVPPDTQSIDQVISSARSALYRSPISPFIDDSCIG